MPVTKHPITGEPVLFAPGRAARPHAFGEEFGREERCPFCPGHEEDTPPEIERVGDPWKVRVFPNKYPPTPGAEVIVDSPDHESGFAGLAHAAEVVRVYLRRLRAHCAAPYTALFRNEGRNAGASIPHPHSQLVPLPFVPRRIEDETAGFANAACCPLCALREVSVVAELPAFRWVTARGTRVPYEQWIVPRRHVASAAELDDGEAAELSSLLQSSSRATGAITASYNWSFMNFRHPAAHFYVDVLPRLTTLAGLEMGSGAFVQIVDPADAAARLKVL